MLTSKNDQMKKMSNVNFQIFWKHNIFNSIQNDMNVKKKLIIWQLCFISPVTSLNRKNNRDGWEVIGYCYWHLWKAHKHVSLDAPADSSSGMLLRKKFVRVMQCVQYLQVSALCTCEYAKIIKSMMRNQRSGGTTRRVKRIHMMTTVKDEWFLTDRFYKTHHKQTH